MLQRKKTTKQILVGDRARPGIQAQVSLPENTNYANLLNRRYSHSLPSLQTSGKIKIFRMIYFRTLINSIF